MMNAALIDKVRHKYEVLAPLLHEQARRLWAACEARALGRGGRIFLGGGERDDGKTT